MSERTCNEHKHSILNVKHLLLCDKLDTHRTTCISSLLSNLSHDKHQNSTRDLSRHCRHWFESGDKDDLRSLLNHIGFIASAPLLAVDNSHISFASMFGAFHSYTANTSLRLRGVSSEYRSALIDSIRLTLIENLFVCFNFLVT